MEQVTVSVLAADEISRVGVIAFLEASGQVRMVEPGDVVESVVVVLVADEVTVADLNRLRGQRGDRGRHPLRCVVVTDRFDPQLTMRAVECGVKTILPRAKVSEAMLTAAVTATAKGSAHLPARLQRALIEQLNVLRCGVLEPRGYHLSGIAHRELDVLGLVADGLHIDEIAARVPYSVGTVKNVLYGLVERLGLQNRTHAVAYAIRAGDL